MIVYTLVFVFQFFFNIFKTLEIKYTYEHKVNALLLNSIWINLVSLGSTYFSLERLIAGEWSILIVYIGGSVVGKWVAMTKVEMYKKRIKRVYNKLKNK
jgi:ABC-type enterochelin transport system permease subunit|tara:strand:- start:911 stop:1207 length:297 start_codon:yes stop_codon:yes gene_type:complete